MNGSLPEPERVLLTRLSAIGDCILTLPLAVRAKALWPSCRLTWVVECGAVDLLEPHPAVDEVLKIERGWLKRPSEWLTLRQSIRERNVDLVLDPQGLTKSGLIGWMSGARQRIGFDYSQGREVAPLVATRRVGRTHRHMVDTYLQLLSPWCEIEPGQGRFEMPVYPEAARRAEQILNDLGWQQQSWIALNPGAGWTTRLWPVQRFGMLAREIYRETGQRSLVFWAGSAELLMARVVEEESQGAAVVAPATTLCEMAELLRRTELLVTGDTGPLHLASAVGAPCVSLHGPTWSDESGPYGNRHIALQSPLRPPTKKLVRKGPNISMQAIELNDVFRACQQLLATSAASSLAAA